TARRAVADRSHDVSCRRCEIVMGPSRGRRYILLHLLLAGFGVILFRLVSLQVLQAAELTARADRQHQKSVTMEGARGTVTDRHGKVFAMNVEVPSIFASPLSFVSLRMPPDPFPPCCTSAAKKLKRSCVRTGISSGWRGRLSRSRGVDSSNCRLTASAWLWKGEGSIRKAPCSPMS